MDENKAKNSSICSNLSKVFFQIQKSFTELSEWTKNICRSERISSHGIFAHFHFYVKTVPE